MRGAACFFCTVVCSGESRARLVVEVPILLPPPPSHCSLHSSHSGNPVRKHPRLLPALGPFHSLPDHPFLGCSHGTLSLTQFCLNTTSESSLLQMCKLLQPLQQSCSAGYFYFSLLPFWSRSLQGLRGNLAHAPTCDPGLAGASPQSRPYLHLLLPVCMSVSGFLLLTWTPGFWTRAHPDGLVFTNDVCKDPTSI